MVNEIRGAKTNPKSSFKNLGAQIRGGGNYGSKYGIYVRRVHVNGDWLAGKVMMDESSVCSMIGWVNEVMV